jgi:hypothetical protein
MSAMDRSLRRKEGNDEWALRIYNIKLPDFEKYFGAFSPKILRKNIPKDTFNEAPLHAAFCGLAISRRSVRGPTARAARQKLRPTAPAKQSKFFRELMAKSNRSANRQAQALYAIISGSSRNQKTKAGRIIISASQKPPPGWRYDS